MPTKTKAKIKTFPGPNGQKLEQRTYASGDRRYYVHLNGQDKAKRCTGPTTILNAVSKPALRKWYAEQQQEACLLAAWDVMIKHADQFTPDMGISEYRALFEETMDGVIAADKVKEESATIGTDIHEAIEQQTRYWLAKARGTFGCKPVNAGKLPELVREGYAKWLDWVDQNNVQFVEAELGVYSTSLHVAGQMDALAYVDGVLTVIDYKTGKSIYGEAVLQAAAYAQGVIEWWGYEPKQAIIVNVPRLPEHKWSTRLVEEKELWSALETFSHVQHVYRWQQAELNRWREQQKAPAGA